MEVRFIIDEHTHVSIPFKKPLAEITKYEEDPINLVENGEIKYLLCGNFDTLFGDEHTAYLGSILVDTWCALFDLKRALEEVLAGNVQAPKEVPDLGYAWNESRQESRRKNCSATEIIESLVTRKPIEDTTSQVEQCILWNPPGLPSTLLYNQGEAIIFQVVPLYHPEVHKISYEEFIKNYSPHVTHILSQANAEQWLKQVTDILDAMEENTPDEDL